MKFYETTISKQLIGEVKYCMQGQDDDVSSLEDDHGPRNTPEKIEFQVGNYFLVNYEEELWPIQIRKIISSFLICVKWYRKAAAPAGSTWRWPKKTDEQDYHIINIKHKINIVSASNYCAFFEKTFLNLFYLVAVRCTAM